MWKAYVYERTRKMGDCQLWRLGNKTEKRSRSLSYNATSLQKSICIRFTFTEDLKILRVCCVVRDDTCNQVSHKPNQVALWPSCAYSKRWWSKPVMFKGRAIGWKRLVDRLWLQNFLLKVTTGSLETPCWSGTLSKTHKQCFIGS